MPEITVLIENTSSFPALFSSNVVPGGKVSFVSRIVADATLDFPDNPFEGPGQFKLPGNGEPLGKTVAASTPAGQYPFTLTSPKGTFSLLLDVGVPGLDEVGFILKSANHLVLELPVLTAEDDLRIKVENEVGLSQVLSVQPLRTGEDSTPFDLQIPANGRALPFQLSIRDLGPALALLLNRSTQSTAEPLQSGGTEQIDIIVRPDGR